MTELNLSEEPIVEEDIYVVGQVKFYSSQNNHYSIMFNGDETARLVGEDVIENTDEWYIRGEYLYEKIVNYLCPECKETMFRDERNDEWYCPLHQ